MQDKIIYFLKEEQGTSAAEYAILASLIAAVIILAVTALGLATNSLFSEAANEFEKF